MTTSSAPERIRVFCFPFAGGGATLYRQWAPALSSTSELAFLHFPGREQRISEDPVRDLSCLVVSIVTAISPHLDLPFVFFGHSFGALVAFETARLLRAHGLPMPSDLIVSGCPAPSMPPRRQPVHHLPDNEFIDEIRRYGGGPAEVWSEPELLALLLPALRADFEAAERYRFEPGPPLPVAITAWAGYDDEEVTLEELEGWRKEAGGEFSLRQFPGHHFYLADSPEFLSALQKKLSMVRSHRQVRPRA